MWKPIAELGDRYESDLLLHSPHTVDADTNPTGVTVGHWQDDVGWVVAVFNNYNADAYESLVLPDEEGLMFMHAVGPESN